MMEKGISSHVGLIFGCPDYFKPYFIAQKSSKKVAACGLATYAAFRNF
jgi:hypothetical protein